MNSYLIPSLLVGLLLGGAQAQAQVKMMKEGDQWQLVIPANLAYDERGAGDKIGPNSALIFEVDLISLEKPN